MKKLEGDLQNETGGYYCKYNDASRRLLKIVHQK